MKRDQRRLALRVKPREFQKGLIALFMSITVWSRLRRWLRGATLAIIALSGAAVRPIFAPAWPCADDIAFHLLRLTQLDHLLRQGVLYSRWAPDMAQGYGFPFFNFYAPLAYYVAAGVSWLGGGLAFGLRATFALAVVASGLAAYRLARDHFSQPAALVTAVAYMYAPYLGYDIYFRGNLAESAAWPLLPLSLWAMGRLARNGGWGWVAATGLGYAAVLLTHNVFALIFSPLLAAYGLIMAAPHTTAWRRLWPVGGALALGLGLTTFFWLPAMLERSLVYSERLLTPPFFVYWNHFLTWREILAPPGALYPDLINPSPARTMGLLPILLALPALFGLRRNEPARAQIAFFGGATLVYALLMTAVSRPVWDHLPLLAYVQFPWRLLGPAALCLAMLAAATIDLLPRQLARQSGAAVVMIALVLSGLLWFQPRYCAGLERPTIADIPLFERQTNTIGTTAAGEYLPRVVKTFPPEPAGETFTAAGLPAGSQIISQSVARLRYRAEIEMAAPGAVTVNLFAYPGWRVWVNGRPVPIAPSADYGLITFPVDDGRQEIMIRFGETPLRLAANMVSLFSLTLAAGLIAVPWRLSRRLSLPPPAGSLERITDANGWFVWTAVLLGFALLATVHWLPPRWPNPLYRPGLPDAGPATTDYVGGMRLLDAAGWSDGLPADSPIRVDLLWTVTERPQRDYQATILLVGPDGNQWRDGDTAHPAGFRPPTPTTAWSPGQYAQDSHLIIPLPGTPPGVYELQLVLFDRASLQPAARPGLPPSPLPLGTVWLARPSAIPEITPQYATAVTWETIVLSGYNLDRDEAAPGDPFLLTLFWRALAAPAANWVARLTLLSPDGAPALQQDFPLTRDDFPPDQWRAGDQWRGQRQLRLPAALASGDYRWRLQLCAPQTGVDGCQPVGATADLGAIRINAPTRLWTPPPLMAALDAPLGDLATLLGANWQRDDWRPAETLTVDLVWRAEMETAVSYAVFLHLLGPDGGLIAQHDGAPANWTRPTTGWLPGEIIVDARALSLPPELPAGRYTLLAGLYEPETGRRLALPDGETAVIITAWEKP